jgi:hypothetical protein
MNIFSLLPRRRRRHGGPLPPVNSYMASDGERLCDDVNGHGDKAGHNILYTLRCQGQQFSEWRAWHILA